MNKKSIIIIGVFFCFILSSSVFAGDVAYIYNNKLRVDNNVVSIFNSLGLSVDFINSNSLPLDLSSYKLVFVGDEYFSKEIPVENYRTLVFNHYLGAKSGLTDRTGISSMTSTTSPKVSFNGTNVQVYTSSKDPSGNYIPYYFLSNTHKSKSLTQYAGTYSTSSGNYGDVISFANNGSVMSNGKSYSYPVCFFGAVKSNYWTNDAKKLFKDCIDFAILHTGESNTTNETQNNFTIACFNDNECGLSDFIGNGFCNSNDVMKNFVSYKCNNPGTIQSFCSNSISLMFLEKCNDFCSDGVCQNYVCSSDSECDDLDPNTIDSCINLGTKNSACSNIAIPIVCKLNSDCDDNDVSTEDSCINPGQKNSICLHNIFYIRCNSDSECDDSISNSVDSCNNPGSFNSSCSHHFYNIRCNSDSECDDLNSNTNDICINPGIKESSCNYISYSSLFPLEVSQLYANSSESSVVLSFSIDLKNSSGIGGYYFSKDNLEWVFSDKESTSFTFFNLNPNTLYTFYMRAVDDKNLSSFVKNISVYTLNMIIENNTLNNSNLINDSVSNEEINQTNISENNESNNSSEIIPSEETNSGESSGSGSGGSSSGGSGGSGGGGSYSETSTPLSGYGAGGLCVTKWSCTEWSSCINEEQFRTCYYPPDFCTPQDARPIEEQNCVGVEESIESYYNNTSGNESSHGGISITGGVIGALSDYPLFWVGLFLIIIALAYLYVRYRPSNWALKNLFK